MNHSAKHKQPEPHWTALSRLRSGMLPAGVAAWVRDRGSLTRAVRETCTGGFEVAVQSQGWGRPLPGEGAWLGLPPARVSLIREVKLLCAGEPWVFARTLIPVTSLRGAARRLSRLGNRPLGAVLFAGQHPRRQGVQVARITPQHALFHAACSHLDSPPAEIWGRRTLFLYAGKPLLVNEIFLPAIPARRT